jgi:hypothetical protein
LGIIFKHNEIVKFRVHVESENRSDTSRDERAEYKLRHIFQHSWLLKCIAYQVMGATNWEVVYGYSAQSTKKSKYEVMPGKATALYLKFVQQS